MAETIAGYEIVAELGRGGMGVVYHARDATLDRNVALKVIKAETLSEKDKERFLREARACSAINHPNIVTVYAAGEDAGRPYLAMEYLHGRTIAQAIEAGPMPWQEAVRYVMDLLDALGRLHAEGIVHRDLKPDNIIITEDGLVKLMDFGIARVDASKTLTVEGATLGTVFYMSPEQAAGQKVDARSDLFSIAGVLYEMITGKLPFEGEHPMSVMYSITNSPHRPLAQQPVEAPAALDAILDRAFEKEADDRFPDAAAFREALAVLVQPAGAMAGGLSRKSVLLKVVLPAVVVVIAAVIAAAQFFGGRAPEFDRTLAVNHNELGQNYIDAGKTAEAQIEFRKAIDADPTYELPWNNLAVIAMHAGELEEADSLARRAVEIDPGYSAAHFNLGNIRWDLGDTKEAERYFRASVDADSSFIAGYNNLAALLSDIGRAGEAMEVVNLGLVKRPNDPFLLKKKGQIAFAMNRDLDALTSWNTAFAEAERRGTDPRLAREVGARPADLARLQVELHALLGGWYERHNNLAEAEKHWIEVEKSEVENDRRQAEAALERIRSR